MGEPSHHDPLVGRQLANFRIERLLGRGGMAQVYFGRDLVLQRPVAIKVVDARLRDSPAYAQRFLQEARTVAQWRHEHIVQVYYAAEEDGLFYFVMEYIEGQDLGQVLARAAAGGQRLPNAEVLRVGRAVASALDYAHERGVIHRDVKPANVIVAAAAVAEDSRVALADFGLALDIHQGSIGETFGSAHYIAPEQARRSSAAVPQSDLYSLGVMLYEMLAGAVPFDDPSPTSLALQHVMLPPPPPRSRNPDLNEATEAVLLKALAKEPEDRYQSGRELMDALASALAEPPAPPATPVQERVGRRLAAGGIPPGREVPTPVPAMPPARQPGRSRLGVLLLAGGGLLALVVVAAAVALAAVLGGRAGDGEPAAGAAADESDSSGTATAMRATASLEGSTPAATATLALAAETLPATGEAGATATATTAAATPLPAETGVPTSPTGPPVQPTATVLYPAGRLVQLFYDAYSFYVFNPGSERIGIKPIAFEALLGAGDQPAGYRFDGSLWSQFYFFLEGGKCDRIETTRAPSYLRPAQCRRYNATVTPQIGNSMVFWIPRPGVSRFGVFWSGQEIARCPIEAGFCEVFLPP